MKGHNWGICKKCGRNHGLHPRGMLNKKNPNAFFVKGHTAWNKGKHCSKKTKEKIQIACIGKCHSPKTLIQKGQHISEKTEFKKGHVSWNKGLTKETDERIMKYANNNKGNHYSYHNSPQIKRIWSDRAKKQWSNPEIREKMIKAILKGLLRRPTSLEKTFMEIIDKNNLPYKYVGNGNLLIGWKNPDFINRNGDKICIEIANRFHHQGTWKEKRIEHFSKYGWKCLVFFADKYKENNWKWKFFPTEETIVEILRGN